MSRAVDCNKKRKGEQHAFMYNAKTGKIQRAMFCGPFTHVLQRIRDGCQGISEADRVCRAHDLRFMLARGHNMAMWIRDADNRMVRKLKQIKKEGTDTRFNTDVSMRAIQLKKKLEDYNVMRKGSFGPATQAGEKISPADRKFLQQELNRMTQQGYGSDLFLESVKWAAKNKDTAIPLFGLASGALAGGIGYAGSKLFGKKKKKKQKGNGKKKPKKKVNKKKK